MTPMSDGEPHWHALRFEDVLNEFNVTLANGLTHEEVLQRRRQYGSNTLPEPRRRSLLKIFLHQFLSPLIYLLLAAASVAFFIGEVRDAIVIIVVVLLNAIIGAFQEGRAEQSLEALRRLSKLKARILRAGHEQIIEASEIVPGDILVLNSGDAIPADARLIQGVSLSAAEAALTGESLPVTKSIDPIDSATPSLIASIWCSQART